MRDSMIFYRNFRDALSRLPDKDRLEAYEALFNYALDDMEIPFTTAGAFVQILVPLIDKNNRNYENGKKGGRPKNKTEIKPSENRTETETKPNHNQFETNTEPNVTHSVIVLKSNSVIEEKNNSVIEEKNNSVIEPPLSPNRDIPPKGKRFTPPTVDEVRAYCRERGNNVDAEKFVDFYTAKGWKVGKNPMKDWKAAVRTWERRVTDAPKTSTFSSGMMQRPKDYVAKTLADLGNRNGNLI